MKKIIFISLTFLSICFIADAYLNTKSTARYLYLNNISIPTGNGYTTDSLEKTENGSQYINNETSKKFYAYVYGYDTLGTGPMENSTRYTISANESGELQDVSSQINYGYGKGQTHIRLVSAGLFSRTFQGAWIPDKSFYDYLVSNGQI